ncbi:hypothetical protein ABKV19_010701 [Rosa sericea]
MEWMSGHKDVLPFTAMIIVECINMGSGVFFKAAASRGLSYYVLIVYSYAIATILLLPLPFIFRRTGLPPFKLSFIFKLFLLVIIGFLGSLCVYKGIEYSSPTLASAIGNLSPAFIFILALTFSMERLNWRSRSTQAKVMGTLVSISGALVVVLYKGPTILSPTTPSILGMSEKEWVKGGLLLTLGYLLFSMWAILQTHIMKTYPDELVLAFLYNLCGTIVSAPTCLIAEKNLIAWRLTPAATSRGLSYYVFIVYSYAIATILLFPLTFIFRRTELPPFKLTLLFKLLILGLIGVLGSLCVYKGIEYSSPTLASAMGNLSPAFIFILAVVFRMERVTLRSSSSQAKVMGTLASISGAMIVVLYKGPTILSITTEKDWIEGGLLLTVGYLLFSAWCILQTHIMKIYPDELVLAFLYNLCGTIISAPVCSLAERNLSAWRPRPIIPLLAIIYSGVFGSSVSILVHIWGLHLKGPVYISSFKPLSIAIAAAFGVIFLGDGLSLGSAVGAATLSIGFYAVIWGKGKEEEISEDCGFDSLRGLPIGKAPLLESYKVEAM